MNQKLLNYTDLIAIVIGTAPYENKQTAGETSVFHFKTFVGISLNSNEEWVEYNGCKNKGKISELLKGIKIIFMI